ACGLEVDVRAVDRAGDLVVPAVGLVLGDLPPAAHLGEVPDGVRVVGIGRVVAVEDVEVGDCALVALLVLEGAGHRVGDHRGVGADIVGSRQDLDGFGPVGVVVLVEPLGGADQRLGDGDGGVGVRLREGG